MLALILEDLRSGAYASMRVPVTHLIDFFEAARSSLSYIWWAVAVAPHLSRYDLLELTDLGNADWQKLFYPLMINTERLPFPGLVEPLVAHLVKRLSDSTTIQHVIQLGSGPMEIERQVAERLFKNGVTRPVHFVGVDYSEHAHEAAARNLSELGVLVKIARNLGEVEAELATPPDRTKVMLYNGDALALLNSLQLGPQQVVFHSLFRHHLTAEQKKNLDALVESKHIPLIEYDGYISWINMLVISIGTWESPIIMNGGVFSNRRYDSKTEIRARYPSARFRTPPGIYLGFKNIDA